MNTLSHRNSHRLGVIFLGRKRPGFDPDWGRLQEDQVRALLRQEQIDFFESPEKVVDDAALRRAVAACVNQDVDALAVLQTTMGDGRLAPTLAQLWPTPLILWATPEKPEGDMISSCSLVGLHAWASILRQMGHAFDLVYGNLAAADTRKRLHEAVRLVATLKRLRTVRVGQIGGQAPGFLAMGADPFAAYQALGVQLQSFTLLEFANVVNELSQEAVAADVARLKEFGLPHKDTTDDDLPMASRLYLAMRSIIENEKLDALTIRDWPEMPNTFGQWPFLGVARLAEEGRAMALEGDVDGALSAWIAENLGLGRCYLSDWLEHDHQTITLWHGGAAPISLCEPSGAPGGPRIALHFNNKKPAVLEATIRANVPVTLFRFWRLEGKYLVTAREGQSIKPRRHLMATNGLVRMKEDPRDWFEELCHAGMPHHIVLVQGQHAALLKRMARVMGIHFV